MIPRFKTRSHSLSRDKAALLLPILLLVLSACGPHKGGESPNTNEPAIPSRGVYFWKTRFDPNEAEIDFLKTYDIQKMYVRMFDVDFDSSPTAGLEKVIPVATTVFISDKPKGVEIVPTVFITARAIISAAREEGGVAALAGKIITRVGNMMEYNDLGPFTELQLDCDWSGTGSVTARDRFHALCRETRAILNKDGRTLSVTVRLHQLRQEAPPSDRGVLMLYNTGALRSAGDGNSILSVDDVRAYLKGTPIDFGIPLDFAYPTFGWGVWFRGSEYKGLLHGTDYSDPGLYRPGTDGMTAVIRDHVLERHQLRKGDRIRIENSDPATIREVKDLVRKSFPNGDHCNILYHLDSDNLQKYSSDELQDILGR